MTKRSPIPSAKNRVTPSAGTSCLSRSAKGGFGVVFTAEQLHPVRRKVAVKVIKLGMDTRDVVARFEAERQALAMMDHPNIAKVLDAGSTAAGRPYFVMELVRGSAADATTADRQRLSMHVEGTCSTCSSQICRRRAARAWQKGIIHRDHQAGQSCW